MLTLAALVLAMATPSAAPVAGANTPVVLAMAGDGEGARKVSGPGQDASTDPRNSLRELGLTQGGLAMVGVELNGRDVQDTTELTLSGSELMIRASDVRAYRLKVPAERLQMLLEEQFIPLSAIPGLRYSIDAARQVLRLYAPLDSFETTALSGRQNTRHALSPVMPSAFISYDLTLQQGASGKGERALFLDMGATNHIGSVENTMLIGNTVYGKTAVRLDTSFVRDDPDGMRRLSIGDGVTRGSAWAPQVRFGGIRYGTDFSLQPNYLTFPTPTFAGRAALPSNVELYVNDVLGYQGSINQGPFSLNQVPVVNGAGHVSLIVRDPLGVEQKIVSSFYVSTEMLRAGLSEFSVEGGAERNGYGYTSFGYRRPFTSGTWRRGLNSNLTVETHAEASARLQSVGGGISTTFAHLGEMGGSMSVSNAAGVGTGALYRAYWSRNDSHWSLSAVYQGATARYRQVGDDTPLDRLRQIVQLNAGVTLKRWGSLNASAAQIKRGDGSDSRVLSLNFSREIPRMGFLSAYVINSHATGSPSQTRAGLTFTATLGPRTSASFTGDQHNQRLDLQRLPPDEEGWGYRVSAGRGGIDQQEADVTYRAEAFEATAAVSHYEGQVSGRLVASGSLVVADGSVFPARRLNGSYAIVDTDGQSGVRVYEDNRPVATTNSRGRAVVTQLRPYEENHLAIEPGDLQLDSTMTTETQIVVPKARAAVLAHFSIESGHAGSVILHHGDGTPVTPGAAVSFSANNKPSAVGFDGEVFVPALSAGLMVTVHEDAGDCSAKVPALPKDDILPRIGPLTCLRGGPSR